MIMRMKRFLHITIVDPFVLPQHQTAIERVMDSAGDWLRYGPNCWIVYSAHPPVTWANRLNTIRGLASKHGFLVTEMGVYAGMLDQKVWDWMARPRSNIDIETE